MAMCPRCHQDKPFLADKCPHCTADVPIGRQAEFSAAAGMGAISGFLFVLWLISLLFS
jgi:hypothetical protein